MECLVPCSLSLSLKWRESTFRSVDRLGRFSLQAHCFQDPLVQNWDPVKNQKPPVASPAPKHISNEPRPAYARIQRQCIRPHAAYSMHNARIFLDIGLDVGLRLESLLARSRISFRPQRLDTVLFWAGSLWIHSRVTWKVGTVARGVLLSSVVPEPSLKERRYSAVYPRHTSRPAVTTLPGFPHSAFNLLLYPSVG